MMLVYQILCLCQHIALAFGFSELGYLAVQIMCQPLVFHRFCYFSMCACDKLMVYSICWKLLCMLAVTCTTATTKPSPKHDSVG